MRSYITSFFKRPEELDEKSEINTNKEEYIGTLTQRAYIREKIDAYNKINLEFTSSCKTISVMGSSALLLCFWSFVPAGLLLAGYYAFGDFKNPADVKAQSSEFQTKLKELFRLYQWMTRKGACTTNDVLVIDLLKTIANNIVQTDDLIPDNFIHHAKEIDEGFFTALEKTPHETPSKILQLIYDEKKIAKETSPTHENKKTLLSYAPRLFRSTPCQRVQQGVSQMIFGYDSSVEKMPEATLKPGRYLV